MLSGVADFFTGEKATDRLVEKRAIDRTPARACRMSPERGNRDERHAPNELRLEAGVADREIEIGFRRHVEHRHGDRSQRALEIAVKARRPADVVALPGARL